MRDSLGNKIMDNSLLCWHPSPEQLRRGLIVQAVRVLDGGLALADSKQLSPAVLVIQIPVHIDMGARPGTEPVLEEFISVVNPNAEAAIDEMLKGKFKQ